MAAKCRASIYRPYVDARLYGELKFKLKGQDWVDWSVARYLECVRVCKGLVAWVVEGKTKQFRYDCTPALLMADLHRAGVRLRKPPIFQRVGIPGSGANDWWRNDYEFIVCATKGKLPWSDNTATGHPPKWAPGGEMSYRLTDGERRNQWGGSSNGKTDSETGPRIKNGKRQGRGRPSHVTTRKRLGRGMANGTEGSTKGSTSYSIDPENYSPPKLANPGNVIK